MKNLLLASLLLLIAHSVKAQTILEIKNGSQFIDGRVSNTYFRQEADQYKFFINVMTLDLFKYYDLQNQYDSDLKKKVYSNTEDYKSKLSELQKKRNELKNTSFYLDFEPEYYERNRLIKYDLNNKTFTVTNEVYQHDFYNKPAFIQFDSFVFKCPIGFSVTRSQYQAGGVDFIKQSISFKIEDESQALKIEENKMNLRLLFVFRLTEATPYSGLDIFGNKSTLYAFSNALEKIILYNSNTNEIYQTYK